MKKLMTIALALVVAGSLSSCGGGSKKGAWTAADKEEGIKKCKEGGKGQSIPGMSAEQVDKMMTEMCGCIIDKAEKNYDNMTAADGDVPGMEKIGTECGEEYAKKMLEDMGVN